MGIHGRFIEDIELKLPGGEVEEEINSFLQGWDFYPTTWKSKACFCADYRHMNGARSAEENLKRMYFFKYVYADGVLHIEAWVRDGESGETGITGFYNFAMKQPYLKQITSLINALIDRLPADSGLRQKNQTAFEKLNRQNKGGAKSKGLLYVAAAFVVLWALYNVMIRFWG